jgi:hydroxymethylglutaryl-CoA reductase (NADPH)
MPTIPPFLLKRLYVKGSLRAENDGFTVALKNVIAPATMVGVVGLEVDGRTVTPSRVTLVVPNGNVRPADDVSHKAPVVFPVGAIVTLRVADQSLEPGSHEIIVHVVVKEVGPLGIPISDHLG